MKKLSIRNPFKKTLTQKTVAVVKREAPVVARVAVYSAAYGGGISVGVGAGLGLIGWLGKKLEEWANTPAEAPVAQPTNGNLPKNERRQHA